MIRLTFDEIINSILDIWQNINNTNKLEQDLQDFLPHKECSCLIEYAFSAILSEIGLTDAAWKSEIMYFLKHTELNKQEMQEVFLIEEMMLLLQNGPIDKLSELLYRYGSSQTIGKYTGWLSERVKAANAFMKKESEVTFYLTNETKKTSE